MKNLISFLIILLFITCCLAQSNNKANSEDNKIRLNLRKPSAFITFEKYGNRTPIRQGESEERIWLRFHNNTKWKMSLRVLGPCIDAKDENQQEWQVSYEVRIIPGYEWAMKETEIPSGYRITHKATLRFLASGQSLLFSVPKENLVKGLSIFVNFSYEWEINGDAGGDLSIVHEAPFWSTDLPEK